MKKPLISIITVSYNASKTIEDTIKSVINQTYDNIEYIIIDGGSTDGTVDIIKKYSNNITYWTSEPDNGIYDAMNKGIAFANGELIGIINSDDWYENGIIEHIVEYYLKSKTPKIFYGDLIKHYSVCVSKTIKPHRPLNQFWMGTIIGHPTVFVSSIFYQKYGLFNPQYKISADYDLLVRMYKRNVDFEYIPHVISHMRVGGESDRHVILGYNEAFNIALNAGYPFYKVMYAYIRKIFSLFYSKLFYKK